MSQNTQHSLTWKTDLPTRDELVDALTPLMMNDPDSNEQGYVDDVISGNEAAKWYDSDYHVALLSKRWPDTVFTMTCLGDDGNTWVTFFKNGRHLTESLQVPEFDPARFADKSTIPLTPREQHQQILQDHYSCQHPSLRIADHE